MFLWLIRCTEFMYYCKSLFTNNTITRQVLKTLSWPNQYELSLLILGVIRLSRKYDEAQIEHQTAVTQSDSVTPATNCRITCKSKHTTQQTDWGADSIHSYIFFHLFNSRLLWCSKSREEGGGTTRADSEVENKFTINNPTGSRASAK